MIRTTPLPIEFHVGQQLKNRRESLGLSRQGLASLLGVSSQQISKYETGKNQISPTRLYQLSQVLSVNPNYFFDGAGSVSLIIDEESVWLSSKNLKGQKVRLKIEKLYGTISEIRIG